MRGFLIAVCFAAIAVCAAAPAEARPLGSRDVPNANACPAGVRCGTLWRPLDPTGVVPGKVGVRWWLYRRTGRVKHGTIVVQEGGPGYPSTDTSFAYLTMLGPLRRDYDILMVNARGTGISAIECASVDTREVRTPHDVGRCGRYLKRASVLFGTRLAVDDMKAVLDLLNIREFRLYGDSYGTFFSQVFAATYPGMLRAVVLDGAYPVGQSPWYPENAAVVRDGFNAACARVPYCAALGRTSMDRIREAIVRVRWAPITGRAPDGDGKMRDVTVDAPAIGSMLFGGAGMVIFRELDAAVRAYFAGDNAPILRLVAENDANEEPQKPINFSYGAFSAVSCMDYQQIYDMNLPVAARREQRDRAIAQQTRDYPGTFAPLTIDEFLRLPLDISVLDLCLEWPVANPPYPPGRPIAPDAKFTAAPTLVISGEFDTLTGPAGGGAVAAQFPNARHIVMANSFHVDAIHDTDGCAAEMVRRFIATLNAGDVSCAARIRPIRLVPHFARRAADATPADARLENTATVRDLALASAAVQTAGDAIARWQINSNGKGVGLYGGAWTYTGAGLTPEYAFTDVRWSEDLAVSGSAIWNGETGNVVAKLTYTNADGETTQLTAEWNDRDAPLAMATLSGTVGNRIIRAAMPAP